MKRLLITAILFFSLLWPLEVNSASSASFLIVNKQTNELALIEQGEIQKIYQVATGATKELTPEGMYTILVKAVNPYYRKLDIPGGTPENPLGTRWIGFDAKGTDGRIYGIHGTNKPDSIGENVSAGCIRMKNDQIEELFTEVSIGTKILVTDTDRSFTEIAKERIL